MPEIAESLFIDEIIDNALTLCRKLPEKPEYLLYSRQIRDLRERLTGGRLRIAVLGQFNRGKSTFINALLGMEILPVSVLPITSVPTVISFGTVNECVVSFSDDKEDAVVTGKPEAICDHLTAYVTEQHNPKNRLCVSEAVVRCASQLLEHGTIIIDTPGFGSTHTHNTETTLDLLSSCDAALFLLSADLPITQVEIDFLQKVLATVPRLFFIYNKIDLLNASEREISEKFITDTLVQRFGFTLGIRLFPVSAKGMKNKQKESRAFKESGLAAVEKEVIDFLLREKYFTLSEALTGKCRDALEHIVKSLTKNRDAVAQPVQEKKAKLDSIADLEKSAQSEMRKALSLSEVEETALYDHFDKLVNTKRQEVQNLIRNRIKELLNAASRTKQEIVVAAALKPLLEEILSRLCIFFLTEMSRPLRNAATAHIREIRNLADRIEKELSLEIQSAYAFKATREDSEVEMVTDWQSETPVTFSQQKASFLDRFAGPEKWQQDMLALYTPQVSSAIDTRLEELSQFVQQRVTAQLDAFMKKCRADYTFLIDRIIETREEAEGICTDAKEKAEPELQKLDSLIEGFVRVSEMVV